MELVKEILQWFAIYKLKKIKIQKKIRTIRENFKKYVFYTQKKNKFTSQYQSGSLNKFMV